MKASETGASMAGSAAFSILNGSIINEGSAPFDRYDVPFDFQYPQRIDNQ